MVREIKEDELVQLLELYTHLHEKIVPDIDDNIKEVWNNLLTNKDYHCIVYEDNGKIVSTCILYILPNLSRSIKPFAVIENVVTHKDYRGKGYSTKCLNYAREIAKQKGVYFICLLTGSKEESTHRFYRNAGYNADDKTGYIQWIKENCLF